MRQGQTTLEYVYLVGIVAVALIVMLVYISRGFQGNLRGQADQLGEQYSPRNMTTNIIQVSTINYHDKSTKTDAISNTTTTMVGSGGREDINSLKNERY